MKKCLYCCRQFESWTRYDFCTGCGQPLVGKVLPPESDQQQRICRRCGKPILAGQDYCGACGTEAEKLPPIATFASPPFLQRETHSKT